MNYPNKVTAVMSRDTVKGELLRKLAAKPNQRVDVDEKLNKWSVATAYTHHAVTYNRTHGNALTHSCNTKIKQSPRLRFA